MKDLLGYSQPSFARHTIFRQYLADMEKADIANVEKHPPAAMSAEKITKLFRAVTAGRGATSKKETGAVISVHQIAQSGPRG